MKLTSNLSQSGLFVILFNLLIISHLFGQASSVCPVNVGKEPMSSSQDQSVGLVSQSYSINASKWQNIDKGRRSDDAYMEVHLGEFKRSMVLEGKNFNFQIPPHAIVSGIMLQVEGKSSNPSDLKEIEVALTGPNGLISNNNYANAAKNQGAWSTLSNGTDSQWMYGSSTDTWGSDWKGTDVNSSEFGFRLHLRNSNTDSIDVYIDKINLTVFYTPLYNFCEDNCLTFYIDRYETFGSYIWKVPQGFRMVSHTIKNQTIDLKVNPDTPYGQYEICVDVFDYSNNYVETCCRPFVYEDCTSSSISGVAWQDFNNNALNDLTDGTLSNVEVSLFTASGSLISTIKTDPSGHYQFSDILNGSYYLKVTNLLGYNMILDNGSDEDFNSDITQKHGVGTTNIFDVQIGQHLDHIDFGYLPLVDIGDFVWEDSNYNGLQDINEKGISKTSVYLWNEVGNLVDSTMTNASGKFAFTQIPAGKYRLEFKPKSPNLKSTFVNPLNNDKNSKIVNDKTTLLTFFEPKMYNNIDAGFYGIGTIGNYVWVDKNGDGLQNPDEQGLANVHVKIKGIDGSGHMFEDSLITSADGRYIFSNLNPGVYTIYMMPPTDYISTLYKVDQAEALDNDVKNGSISNINLKSQDFLDYYDAGYFKFGSIGDFVWEDLNGDGLQTSNEPGLKNVIVSIYKIKRDSFIWVATDTTDQNGAYLFENLMPGKYKLTFSKPAGYTFTANVGNQDDNNNSDVIDGVVPSVMLMSGENKVSIDAGLYRKASIGDFVWEDANANGIQDAGENGIAGVELTLSGTAGNGQAISMNVVTDNNGYYNFNNVLPGNYQVSIQVPQGYVLTIPNAGNDDVDSDFVSATFSGITLTSGQNISNIDAGLFKNSSIGDFVWEDGNANGIQDTGENGISGVELTLSGTAGNGQAVSMNVVTDNNGYYNFNNVLPGNYQVSIQVPQGYVLTIPNAGNDDVDSDFASATFSGITLTSGQNISNIDAGLFKNASIGDFVWEDDNANGIQDAGENGIAGVELTLSGTAGNGQAISMNVVTDNNGYYNFNNVLPGNYQVSIQVPQGYVLTIPNAGNDDVDSDFVSATLSGITLTSGQNISNIDAGLFKNASIGDFVWEDDNANGIQDASENGISGIELTLSGTAGNGQAISMNVVTDNNGYYNFNNVLPGNYQVFIQVPQGYVLTIPNAGNDDVDSDFASATLSGITLTSGQNISNIDAGLFKNSSIGDFVWEDANANGIQDAGENGIAGVELSLSGTAGNGQAVSMNVVTDNNGYYNFNNVLPGNYQVSIQVPQGYVLTIPNAGNDDVDSDFASATLSGITLTSGQNISNIDAGLFKNASIGDFVWEDANANGIQDTGENGISGVELTLSGTAGNGQAISMNVVTDNNGYYNFNNVLPGNYQVSIQVPQGFVLTIPNAGNDDVDSDFASSTISGITLTSGQNLSNIDAGLFKNSSIGDFVWEDDNANGIQDTGENGIAGVELSLSGTAGNGQAISMNVVTDNNGYYNFNNVLPGNYQVSIQVPQGYVLTIPNAGNDDVDSDFASATFSGITLTSGQNISNIDAGLFKNSSIGDFVWEDGNANGIQDASENGISGIELTLSGTAGNGQAISMNVVTDNNGYYNFNNVLPGNYQVSIQVPQGYVLTIPNAGNDDVDSDFASTTLSGITFTSGQSINSIDAGLYRYASIGDYVWQDVNSNGLQDSGEPGINGVFITLNGSTGNGQNIQLTTTSDANGHYSFDNLIPGTYALMVTIPQGYNLTKANIGDDTKDSDFESTSFTGIDIKSGQTYDNYDLGLTKATSIGDFVWEDINANGIQDNGEVGISGVKLTLSGTSDLGVSVLEMTTTDSQGKFSFDNIFAGNYTITIDMPQDYTPTIVMAGNSNNDSNLPEKLNFFSFYFSALTADLSMDIGLVKFASIGDLVWEDLNCNGIRESGEPGVSGTTIKISGINIYSENITKEVISAADGYYLFDKLVPGKYDISIVPSSGFELVQSMILNLTLQSGQSYLNYDIPVFKRLSIGDFVWNDVNGNGIQDIGELGIEGVQIKITYQSTTTQFEKTVDTDAQGMWRVDSLKPGTYDLELTIPQGFSMSPKMLGNDRMIDSDFDDLGKLQISLTSGIDQFDIDAGLISEAKNSVGNLVWDDLNGNGIQDNGEPGIQFMTVDLIGTSTTGQNITLSTQTDFNGNYNFSNLPDGEYQIFVHRFNYTYFTFKNIGDPTKDSNIDPVTEMSEKFTLSGGQSRTDIDAGLYQLGALGDYVWVDEDQDGIQSPSEVGLEGVELILFDGQNNFISSVTTGFGGFYFFSDLIPGTYYIEAMLPQGYTATTPHQSFDSEDSDFEISGTRVITPFLDVISGMNNTNVDLGIFIQKTQISGFTWIDENGDGQFEGNDKKIANLLVTLVDMNNAIISTQITNEDGEYLFENLNPNEYKVKFAATDSLSITYFQLGDPELDSDIEIFPEFSTGIINLSIGDNLTGVNGGFARFSSIGDYVWIDKNEDGIQNNQEVGLNGVLVKLFDEVGTLVDSTYTAIPTGSNSGGFYTFDSLYFGNYYVQFSTVNNFKFSNKYASTPDVNSNADATGLTTVFSLPPSTQLDSIDAGYIILAPVTSNIEGVVWKDVNNNLVKDPSESILSGVLIDLYDINNTLIASTTSGVDGTYKFSNIPFGDYYIKSQKFSDKLFVPYSGFSVPNDSEFTGSFGEGTTRIINLFPGITMTDFDLGYADKITIGDFVWLDANNNGLQDSGEQGFPNVMISLYNQSGQKIKEVTSNSNGGYVFNEIPTGKYNVIFQNLDGYMFAIFNSTNNQTNSKADPKTGQTGLTDYLVAGNYTNVDAGYVVEGTIGDFAWLDLDGNGYQNINEPGISGILIKLFKADGTFVDSTRTQVNSSTDMDGFYEFHKVRPGNYYVKMEFPSQYLLSQALVGDTISDSNITNANGPYTTDTFTLGLGEHRTDIDGAAYLPATLGDFVWNDINKNGIQDAGEPGLPGVVVELYTQSNTLVGRDTTDSSGFYRFGGLKQRLYYLQFRILDGFEFTLQNVGDPSFDSDVDATGTTPLISLAHGATFLDIDAGMYVSSARLVMGTLWYDKNENGIRDEGEPLQKSITTYLKNSAEQTVKSFVTNHAGMYCLSTKVYGEHYVFISLPDDNVFTQKGVGSSSMNSDFNADGSSDMFMLKPGISMQYIDGGYFEKNTTDLSGTVWLDTNPNGIKDDNDTKMKDVVLLCFDKQRNFIKSTKSDDNGLYTFRDLDPGEYYCLLPYYEDKTFIMNTGTQTDNDSEFTNAYGIGTSRLVTLSGNDPTINFDFGYRSKTSQERAQSKSTVDISDVYPNPALHTIYLENNNGNLNDYQIVSPNGEVLRTGTFIVGKNSIDIESLKGGQYYLIINVADGIVVKPIIKANY